MGVRWMIMKRLIGVRLVNFFRAYNYVELIMRYGDVPWIDHVLTEEEGRNDIPQRRPRAEVAELVLNDLLYASENINTGAFAKMDADGKKHH